jgi:hypothetical protein
MVYRQSGAAPGMQELTWKEEHLSGLFFGIYGIDPHECAENPKHTDLKPKYADGKCLCLIPEEVYKCRGQQ